MTIYSKRARELQADDFVEIKEDPEQPVEHARGMWDIVSDWLGGLDDPKTDQEPNK